uniref:Major facilitator superfamily (MFS) profile domain-containing protein n=1 Tax=Panagrolaimus sp. PS1159 TaxID=55785 RepID=A0AC35GN59_9BILA
MEEKNEIKFNLSYCGNSTRYVILTVSILALSFVLANSLALNFTVICMYKDIPSLISSNSTDPLKTDQKLLYSVPQQSWLFSAIAIGNILGTLPLPYTINSFGVQKTFTFYGFISGIATLLLPFFVPFGFTFVFLIRVIQGFGVAISFTSLGAIVSSWSSIKESGTYIAILSCHFQTGAILAMVLGGEFCSNSYGKFDLR